uniref:Enhancer of polycomb-like protein n=3 Tax=Rhodosorus marinus TaxID=101924 RepID=A0A7S2Z9W9_9RHOD|mmetsp:Transcript_11444/g.47637  ORF Transcript_11444/g.47637 Transcript_11444/m.47637 type:complete len:487 (+) Transcript_11444:1475-2935(+)
MAKFSLPQEYINFSKNDEELDSVTVEYEVDPIDEKFIRNLKAQKNLDVTADELEVAMDRLEKMQGRPAEIIPYSVMKGVLTDALPPSTPDMLKKNIYVHWVDRRTLERGGKPFLRFLQPPPDLNDQNPAVAFRQRDDFPLTSGRSRQYRQNTYENYKRLVALRADFNRLRKIVEKVYTRETLKRELVENRLEMKRMTIARLLLPENLIAAETARRKQAAANGEKAFNSAAVSSKKNVRPYDASKEAIAAPVKKKKRQVSTKGAGMERIQMDSLFMAKGNSQPGLDQYSFDEKGRAFLRQMRYISGHFAAHGVSPFDHRVFSAAAERVQLKDSQKESSIVDFPGQLKFVGGVDKLQLRAVPRVGRLGRVFFDPVPPDRPAAITYSASVARGGAYSASLPYELHPELLNQIGSRDKVTPTFKPLEPIGYIGGTGHQNAAKPKVGNAEVPPSSVYKPAKEPSPRVDSSLSRGSLPFYVPPRKSIILGFE